MIEQMKSKSSQTEHGAFEIERTQIPGGHKEGRASFPTQSSYKVFTIPWLKSNLKERKEEEHGGRRRRAPGSFFLSLVSSAKNARANLQGGGRLLFANRPALPLPLCFSSKPFSKD